MDKAVAGILGAVGALVLAVPSQAAVPGAAQVLQARSYSELLRPVPNAVDALAALDAQAQDEHGMVQLTADRNHHHRYVRRRRRTHHHHHNNYR